MEKATNNNNEFQHLFGRRLIVEGLNMQCRPVIVTGHIEIRGECLVFVSRGIAGVVYGGPEQFMVDTLDNRKALKSTFTAKK